MKLVICLSVAIAAIGAATVETRAHDYAAAIKENASRAVLASLETPPKQQPASAASKMPPALAPDRLCHVLQTNAMGRGLPPLFFLRLIWQESRFDHTAVSRRGAQGIAQFMPPTARQWGLHNPFDPAMSLEKSAELLAYLVDKFGNVGLAAAAYNAGPVRVRNWLKGKGRLPKETRDYVEHTTGQPAAFWRDEISDATEMDEAVAEPPRAPLYSYLLEDMCLNMAARVIEQPWPRSAWSVRVAEDVSQPEALRRVARLKRETAQDGDKMKPLLDPIGKVEADGSPRFAVDVAAGTRQEAWALCSSMRERGETCRILRG